jgi:hypothetical protein
MIRTFRAVKCEIIVKSAFGFTQISPISIRGGFVYAVLDSIKCVATMCNLAGTLVYSIGVKENYSSMQLSNMEYKNEFDVPSLTRYG